MLTKDNLLQKYNITAKEFENAGISWDKLEIIYRDYQRKREEKYEPLMREFQRLYFENPDKLGFYAYRFRLKDPEHLIIKIIRKKLENDKKYRYLDETNYENFITDFIGFRGLLLFKDDWENSHDALLREFANKPEYYVKDWLQPCKADKCFAEPPKVHIRKGDDRGIYLKHIEDSHIFSDKIYRSVHYTIHFSGIYIELQVRTLYEEGWSEIDHAIVYPYHQKDMYLKEYSDLLNRLSGLADEMGTYFKKVEHLSGSGSTGTEDDKSGVELFPGGNDGFAADVEVKAPVTEKTETLKQILQRVIRK